MAADEGDDEPSAEVHYGFISSVWPDWDAVKSSMERTVAFRLPFMLETSTVDITATYPWLTIPKLVLYIHLLHFILKVMFFDLD